MDELASLYSDYPTHSVPSAHEDAEPAGGLLRRLRVGIRNAYLRQEYGLPVRQALPGGALLMRILPGPLRWEWDHYMRHLGKPREGWQRLLDVGCGNGEFLLRARAAGWRVVGVEPDGEAARHAIEAELEVHVGSVDDAPFEPESFDVVTTHQVIEHVADPRAFLREAVRWLRPGGRLWVGTPNAQAWLLRWFGCSYGRLHAPYHLVLLSPRALVDVMASAGLQEIRLLRRGIHDIHVAAESDRIARGLHPYGGDRPGLKGRMLGIAGELAAWIDPRKGSDLVVIGTKPQASAAPRAC